MISNIERCTGCSACMSACSTICITMEEDIEGFRYPKIDKHKCIGCGMCVSACPLNVDSITNDEQVAYGAINTNDKIRRKSSSGGIFYLFASYVIRLGGVVYGASFTEDFMNVHHIQITNEDEINYLMGAKYLQSDLKKTYVEVKQLLSQNKIVLFSGTPCQIAGLKTYLKKDYKNLFTVDVICHGVPSSKIWRTFFNTDIYKNTKVKNIMFRNKSTGWKKYSMLVEYADGTNKVIETAKNPYMLGFIESLYLRKSCYTCQFKNENYYSDITLGDFWGIENVLPQMNDDKGTSVIVVHTVKGKELLSKIKDIEYEKVDLEYAMKSNPSYYKNTASLSARKYIMKKLETIDIGQLINEYCGKSFKAKLRRRIHKRFKDF